MSLLRSKKILRLSSDSLSQLMKAYGLAMRKNATKIAKIRMLLKTEEAMAELSEEHRASLEAALLALDEKRKKQSKKNDDDDDDEDGEDLEENVTGCVMKCTASVFFGFLGAERLVLEEVCKFGFADHDCYRPNSSLIPRGCWKRRRIRQSPPPEVCWLLRRKRTRRTHE